MGKFGGILKDEGEGAGEDRVNLQNRMQNLTPAEGGKIE